MFALGFISPLCSCSYLHVTCSTRTPQQSEHYSFYLSMPHLSAFPGLNWILSLPLNTIALYPCCTAYFASHISLNVLLPWVFLLSGVSSPHLKLHEVIIPVSEPQSHVLSYFCGWETACTVPSAFTLHNEILRSLVTHLIRKKKLVSISISPSTLSFLLLISVL